MSSTLADMTAALRSLLLDHFFGSTPQALGDPKPGDPIFAFELGTPVPDETFRLPPGSPQYSPAMALEYMSNQADIVPRIQGDVLFETFSRFDDNYEILLTGALPVNADASELLGQVKRSASAVFDETLGSIVPPGIGRFRPVLADPVSWYDQTAEQNWTTLSLNQSDNPPPPPSSTTPGGPSGPFVPHTGGPHEILMRWRPVSHNMQAALAQPVSMQSVRLFREAKEREVSHAGGQGAAEAILPSDSLDRSFRHRALRLGPLVASAPSRGAPLVTSDGFSFTLETCVVRLRRPWLSDGFLNLHNWFVTGVAKGSICAGNGSESETPLSVLPLACVCVRNVSIKAQWTTADRQQVEISSHLGAFALLGRQFDQNTATLTVPGMQLIAWICQSLPALPPLDPPSG